MSGTFTPELGQQLFGQAHKEHAVSKLMEAVLREIERNLEIVMYNVHQQDFVSPFNNTAESFKELPEFQVEAYSWDESYDQPWNFKCGDVEISWYKYAGRGMSSNVEITAKMAERILKTCVEAVWRYDEVARREGNDENDGDVVSENDSASDLDIVPSSSEDEADEAADQVQSSSADEAVKHDDTGVLLQTFWSFLEDKELVDLWSTKDKDKWVREFTSQQTGGASVWCPISEAKKDDRVILARLHNDIFPRLSPERPDLEVWNGIQVPLRHSGVYEKDGRNWDHGWTVAAPVGSGGIPDEWIAGWMPMPE